jgi:hypothetical protein
MYIGAIVLKLGLTGDPGLEPGRVEEKIGEEKTRCDPVDPDPVKNPVATY